MRVLGCLCLLVALFTDDVRADEELFSLEARKRIAELEREITLLKAENIRLKDALGDNGIALGMSQQTIVTILRELPDDLQPAGGWDKFNLPKVYEWLTDEMTGAPFETVMLVSRIKVGRNPYNKHPSAAWRASIYLKPVELSYGKKLFIQYVGENWPQPLHLDGDENLARQAEAIPVGRKVKVTGKIGRVQLMPTTEEAIWKANISLRDYKVEF